MANILDAYIPEVWAQETLIWLRKNLVMARLVHRNFENEVARQGDTVNTRQPALFTAQAFTGTIGVQDAKAVNVPVILDQHIHVAFEISDKDRSLAIKDLVNEYLGPSGYALADKIDQDIIQLVDFVGQNFGTAGTTPSVVADITGTRKVAMDAKIPMNPLRLVLDPAAEDKFLQLATFHEADKVGDQGTALREASLGRKFGFDIFATQNVPFHTVGSPAPGATVVVSGAHAAGVTAVAVSGAAANSVYKKGDVVTIAGDSFSYGIAVDVTLSGTGTGTITVSPALRVAIASGAAITLKANHRQNVAFHPNAFALVTRPLQAPPEGVGVRSAIVASDGVGIRTTIGYDIRGLRMVVVLDILYGVKALNPDLAVRLLG